MFLRSPAYSTLIVCQIAAAYFQSKTNVFKFIPIASHVGYFGGGKWKCLEKGIHSIAFVRIAFCGEQGDRF